MRKWLCGGAGETPHTYYRSGVPVRKKSEFNIGGNLTFVHSEQKLKCEVKYKNCRMGN